MNRVPDEELVLVPGGSLITETPEEGRALALTLARHTIHNLQPELDILRGPPELLDDPRRPHRSGSGRGHRVPNNRSGQQLLALTRDPPCR
jgi:hypothetical protein